MPSKDSKPTETTHFGYRSVASDDKAGMVRGVFDSVAENYDVMNDLMSLGVHRLWKHFTIAEAGVREGQSVLDLAGGTGDLAQAFAKQVGQHGRVVLSDINARMLVTGRDRLLDAGISENLSIVQANAEQLPFSEHSFDVVTMAFGLRNVTDKAAALRSIHRTLKVGGKALILEFSKPAAFLKPAYDLYSFNVLPWLGKQIADDADSYRYLAESIRMHPDQGTLKDMMVDAGFGHCRYHNLTGGIAALHVGFRV